MQGICESCHLRGATHLVNFDSPHGPDFLVCWVCANAAKGYYGEVRDIPADYRPADGGDAA